MVEYPSRRRRQSVGSSRVFLYSKIAKYALFAIVIATIVFFCLFLWYGRNLPTPGKLITAPLGQSTRIYDRHGELLYAVYKDQNRTYVKLQDIPKNVQLATISVEDKNFYNNQGFSVTGYLRAIASIVFMGRIQGGSTLTQQLVKNVLLTNEQSLPRKIKELMLAIQVDKRYSKDQILEMYLNDVPYGGAAVGVEAASELYFGINVKNLDLAQSAFLAGLPQSPSTYSPYTGNNYYLTRTDIVLQEMVKDHYISDSQHQSAIAEIKRITFSQTDTNLKAPHFILYVKQLLEQQFGSDMVENGGLQVTTTLDYTYQKKAEQIVKEEIAKLKSYHVSNGAAIVANPKTSEILSMVGSEDYFNTANDGNFNVATSPTRQPGSSLKPIMYATALEKGYTASTLLMDVKTDFPTGDPSHPTYTPVNYDGKYHGPVEMRFALGNSFNIPAVKMLAKVGIQPVMQQGYNMGISEWNPTPQNMANVGLSLVLGGRETSLLHEVTAYSTLANQGIRHDPMTILKVTDSKGNVLYQYRDTPGVKVLSPEISFIISDMLADNSARVAEFGPNSYLVIPGHTVSAKTGTTDEKRDNWTIGYTPSLVAGVWVGNNDNSPMSQALASGITGAAPIWNRIMTTLLKDKPDEKQPQPVNVTKTKVDAYIGGLPYGSQPTRDEWFVKGTEPTQTSPDYISWQGKNYIYFKENDPVSTDGKNRWQQGIDDWVNQTFGQNEMYHPPSDAINQSNNGDNNTTTPAPSTTPTPNP